MICKECQKEMDLLEETQTELGLLEVYHCKCGITYINRFNKEYWYKKGELV